MGGGLESVDVGGFEDCLGEAVFGDFQHGAAELFGGGDGFGEGGFKEGEDGIEGGVEEFVELRF